MVIILKSEIKNVISILKGLKFVKKSPESLTNATLITLGEKIFHIAQIGVVTDDDLKWIRDYCYDIGTFWGTKPSWLRKYLSKLSSSANFKAHGLSQTDTEIKITNIVWAYKELTNWFIGVYLKQQEKAA